MNTSPVNAPEPQGLPLCRSYVCVVFDVLTLQLHGEAGVRCEQLRWAVGVLSDGASDYMGCWSGAGSTVASWRCIADDLEARGVERLRFALGSDPVEMEDAMAPHFRDVTVLSTFGAAFGQPAIDALLPGHRRYVERALEVASPMSRRLKRAVARHGSLASLAAAAGLLHQSAQRYAQASWPALPVPPLRAPRAAFSSRLTAAGG